VDLTKGKPRVESMTLRQSQQRLWRLNGMVPDYSVTEGLVRVKEGG